MNSIIILNSDLQRIADLDRAKALNPVLEQDYHDGEQVFSFDYPVIDEEAFKLGENSDQDAAVLVIADPDTGDLLPFTITEIEHYKDNNRDHIAVSAEGLYYELADGPVRDYDLISATAATAIDHALEGTRWQLGEVAAGFNTANIYRQEANPLEMLRRIAAEFDGILRFRMEYSGAQVTAFKVDLQQPDDQFKGLRFEFGRNLKGVEIVTDYSQLKTALYGFAQGDELDLDAELEEPKKMTFADVQWLAKVLHFNGSSTFVDVGPREDFDHTDIELTFRTDSSSGTQVLAAGLYDNICLFLVDGNIWLTGWQVLNGPTVTDGEWHTIRAYKHAVLSLWFIQVDGEYVEREMSSDQDSVLSHRFGFGARIYPAPGDTEDHFEGEIRNVKARENETVINHWPCGDGEGTDIEDIVGTDDGTATDPGWQDEDRYNKPLGQKWVGCDEAREKYGLYDPDTGQRLHRYGQHESEATTKGALLEATAEVLDRRKKPRVTITADPADLAKAKVTDTVTGQPVQLDHESFKLGDLCHVIARHKGIIAALEVRIVRLRRNLNNPVEAEVVMGDPVPLDSDYIDRLDRKMAEQARQQRRLDRGRGQTTITIASEDTSRQPWYADIIVPAGADNFQVYLEKAMNTLRDKDSGGRVVILEGKYIYNSEMLVGFWREGAPPGIIPNVTVAGQGAGTELHLKQGLDYGVRGLVCYGADGINVQDLAIYGHKETHDEEEAGHQNGIHFIGGSGAEFRNLTIKGFASSGILTWQVKRSKIIDCVISDCDLQGINCTVTDDDQIVDEFGTETSDIIISRNSCFDNESNGIRASAATGFLIANNSCNENYQGIRINDLDDGGITGNTCKKNEANGIVITDGCSNNEISDNLCVENDMNGISMGDKSVQNNINANICENNGWSGINLWADNDTDKPNRCNITGNECNDNDWDGIHIWSDENNIQANKCTGNDYGVWIGYDEDAGIQAADNLVTNNDLIGNTDGAIADAGDGTITDAGNRE